MNGITEKLLGIVSDWAGSFNGAFNSYKLDSAGTGPADCTGKECADFTGDPSCGSPFDAGCFQMGDLFSRIQ